MALTLATALTVEPVTLAEAKSQMRVDAADDDVLITALIVAARRWTEGFLHRALVTQTWDLALDAFPLVIDVPSPPLQSVTSIAYIDDAGASQTFDASKYQVDSASQPGRIMPAFGEVWPATRAQFNAVTVRFVAGYGDAGSDVPEHFRQAMLLMVAHWYENREATIVGAQINDLPLGVSALLWPERVVTF